MLQGPLARIRGISWREVAAALVSISLLLVPRGASAADEQLQAPADKPQPPADSTPGDTTGTDQQPSADGDQKPAADSDQKAPADGDEKPAADEKTRETSFAIVPGPFYNPNLGVGVNVIPMLMFHPSKSDAVSPPSLVLLNLLYAIKPPFDDDAGSRQSFVA